MLEIFVCCSLGSCGVMNEYFFQENLLNGQFHADVFQNLFSTKIWINNGILSKDSCFDCLTSLKTVYISCINAQMHKMKINFIDQNVYWKIMHWLKKNVQAVPKIVHIETLEKIYNPIAIKLYPTTFYIDNFH